ncbi:MAG: penicillin acylase family protein [Bacteroidota bacterium]
MAVQKSKSTIQAIAAVLLFALWLIFNQLNAPLGLRLPALGNFINPATGFWQQARHKNTHQSDQIIGSISGVDGAISFTERGVPHIFANNLIDACYMQGYVTARDRLFQMDLSSRATGGRLSEVLGPSTLDYDRSQIRRGFREAARRAERDWRENHPADYAWLEAYSRGINDYIDQLKPEDYPIEYKILNLKPEYWTPYKSALMVKGMSNTLSARNHDLSATYSLAQLGQEVFDQLFPDRNPRQSPIISPSVTYDFESRDTSLGATPLAAEPLNANHQLGWWEQKSVTDLAPVPTSPFNGSNNWAVGPSKSSTRSPILANDPHLGLTLPSIWYELQIQTQEEGLISRGVSLPGLPLIVIGFNEDVAWGETNCGHDVTDWYAIDWVDDDHSSYRLDGEVVEVNYLYDTIFIAGETPRVETTPWTVWGPIVDTTADSRASWLAMHWLAHDISPERETGDLGVFAGLMAAKDEPDMQSALRSYFDPAQNFVLADKSGTIAMRPSGGFPMRAPGQGRFVLDGSKSDNGWAGTIPADQRPAQRNPQRGFVASANQRTTADDYPYYYLGNFDDYRGRYLNRRLAQVETFNQRKIKNLQQDGYSLLAEELMPLLLARVDRENMNLSDRQLMAELADWNYIYSADSRPATFFHRWQSLVYELTVDEIRIDSGFLELETWRWVDLIRNEPGHTIFDIEDTPLKETAVTLTQRAFDEIVETWNEDALPWADERGAYVRHLARIPGFGSEMLRSPGTGQALNALRGPSGPSWRMVVELGDEPIGWGVIPGGSSGNPASPYYDDALREWAAGRYYSLPLRAENDEEFTARWTFNKTND